MRELLKSIFILINKFLARLNLRLTRASTAPRSATGFFDNIKALGFEPSYVIDVGVADGTAELYKAFPTAKYLLVEPHREFEPVLKKICSELDGDYVIAAAAEEPGVVRFNAHEDLFGSSMLDEVEGDLADGEKCEVPALRLDDLIAEHVQNRILLKVDVQGAELKVLGGTSKHLQDIDMIILEVALISSMKGGAEFWDIVRYMKERGFVVYDILGGVFRPLDGCLKQVDLVFVPENSSLRSDRRYATPEQRHRLNAAARRRWERLRSAHANAPSAG